MTDGMNRMISMLYAVSAGEDIWKAYASFAKPEREKHLEVQDTGCRIPIGNKIQEW
jgi:hypothetical protein